MKIRTLVLIATVAVLVYPSNRAWAAAQADQKPAGKKVEAKVVDPVCGMEVDPKTSEKAVYKGKTYYFCSRSEKTEFEKSPEKYVRPDKTKK